MTHTISHELQPRRDKRQDDLMIVLIVLCGKSPLFLTFAALYDAKGPSADAGRVRDCSTLLSQAGARGATETSCFPTSKTSCLMSPHRQTLKGSMRIPTAKTLAGTLRCVRWPETPRASLV